MLVGVDRFNRKEEKRNRKLQEKVVRVETVMGEIVLVGFVKVEIKIVPTLTGGHSELISNYNLFLILINPIKLTKTILIRANKSHPENLFKLLCDMSLSLSQ